MKNLIKFVYTSLAIVSVFCILFALTLAEPNEIRPLGAIGFISAVFALAAAVYHKE